MTAQEHHKLYCQCGGVNQMDVDAVAEMYRIRNRKEGSMEKDHLPPSRATSGCAFSLSESHDNNYGIVHSTVMIRVVKDVEICQFCVGRVLDRIGSMHMASAWRPSDE